MDLSHQGHARKTAHTMFEKVLAGAGRLAALALVALLAASPVLAEEEKKEAWKFKWGNGFKLDSPGKAFKLKFGGRIQADWSLPSVDSALESVVGTVDDGTEVRRARLFFSGTIYENVEFKAQYDFAGGETETKDVWIGLKNLPFGKIRVGHFKEPFSLEEITSSKYITFLERSLNNVFAPGRNVGIMFHDNPSDRFTWAVGYFRESDDFGISDGDNANITDRLTFLPVYEDKGKKLVHLGLSASRKDVDSLRYRQRPEAHISPRFVNTGTFTADSVTLLGLEAATVQGPFWAAAEYTQADVDASSVGDPSFDSFYLQAGYFLTGESRAYKTSAGAFNRNKPKNNFVGNGNGGGAWEIAARYSTLNLTDAGIAGGEIDNISAALNWYLNPATRVMLDYVMSDVDQVGDGDFVLLRFQVDF